MLGPAWGREKGSLLTNKRIAVVVREHLIEPD